MTEIANLNLSIIDFISVRSAIWRYHYRYC